MPTSYAVILIILLLMMIILSKTTNMLRNVVFNMVNFNTIAAARKLAKPKRGFSLARTQLAFWTVIIIGSFIYVVFYSSSSGMKIPISIDPVNLALLGIAAGTTVIGKAIDNSQQNNPPPPPPPPALPPIPQQDIPSKGFFTDIMSDDSGISIHRLQNVLWTLVVGAIYIVYVSNDKSHLPDGTVITPTLLGLMSVSATAYLGVKTTENNTSK